MHHQHRLHQLRGDDLQPGLPAGPDKAVYQASSQPEKLLSGTRRRRDTNGPPGPSLQHRTTGARSWLREQQVILDTAGAGVVFILNRSLRRCNLRFAEIFGHTRVEALQRSNASLYPDRESFHALGQAHRSWWGLPSRPKCACAAPMAVCSGPT